MNRSRLLSGTAVVAAVGLLAGPALAFNEVHWDWNLDADTYIDQWVDIYVDVDPSGFVALENLQVQLGDVTAESYVSDIDNNRPSSWGWFPQPIDAELELTEVVSAATAVGNASSLKSHVSTNIHEAQVLSGALEGFSFQPAEITATSKVWDIENATVDTSATAVGNLKSIELAAVTADDAVLIADIKQISNAEVSALSEVYNVSVNGYDNLVAIDRPIVSSVATAIGNNLSVTVTSPGGVSFD